MPLHHFNCDSIHRKTYTFILRIISKDYQVYRPERESIAVSGIIAMP